MKHISVYVIFSRKTPGQGLRSTDWTFAKKEPIELDVLIGMFAAALSEFCLLSASTNVEYVNESLRKAEQQISQIYFEKIKNDAKENESP